MPTFKLVDGDVLALTRAYNALCAGAGTYLAPCAADAFIGTWSASPRAFVAESGFVAIATDADGAGVLVAAPFTAAFASDAAALLRALVPAHALTVLRATSTTREGDALCEAMGLRYDGLLRALLTSASTNGHGPARHDASFWSLLPADLADVLPSPAEE